MVTAGNTRSFAPRSTGRRWASSFPPATTLITERLSGKKFFGAQRMKLDSSMRNARHLQGATADRDLPDCASLSMKVREVINGGHEARQHLRT